MSDIIAIRTAAIEAQLVELAAQMEQAKAREVLSVGATYDVHVGKGETAALISAVLLGQRTRESGAVEFRFSHGEGFNARFYDVSFSKVVTGIEGMSSNKVASLITRAQTALADVENFVPKTRVAKERPRLVLVVGNTYNLKVGKGETAAVVLASLMAERDNEAGVQEFAVFFGAGFDAKVLTVSGNRFVFDDVVEDEDGEDGIDLDAEYSEPVTE
jgi:hypothetical protein